MSAPVFSMGIVTPGSQKKKVVKVYSKKTLTSSLAYVPVGPIHFRRWFILPDSPNRTLRFLIPNIGRSFEEAKARINDMSDSLKAKGVNAWASCRLLGANKQHLKELSYLCQVNERTRRVMTRLAVRWRRSRLIRANEEDLITMDPPVKRVDLYDWTQKRIYTFEASTILCCLTKRLRSHDGMFATPLHPVNPYTNMKLSLGQLHSVIEQLRSHGLTHWTTEALRSARYCWYEFTNIHDTALQLSAMRSVLSDLNSTECHDTLFDFIDAEYTNNDADIDHEMYRWLIKNAMDSEHMSKWRGLCHDFYKNNILYRDIPIKQKLYALKIGAEAAPLCKLPRELYRLRNRRHTIEITGEA